MSTPHRQPEHPVDPMFVERWSPRAFAEADMSEQELLTILEAGRWAPSAYNVQPWRFIYARSGTPAWAPLLATLHPFNQSWAQRASALLVVVSANNSMAPGAAAPTPNGTHEFDAGIASGYIALQASLLGWHSHAMAGIDKALARTTLGVPDDHAVHIAIAIGRRSEDKSFLSEGLQSREGPSPRLPLSAIASEGRFGR